ncbi:Dehydrodolichyl diphosphate syntase complex subunit Dhdds [Thelohanellus kitauei]|uniref:Alkyl transferase n=1 Tax=Thelohanellus kitauei TaxID=669202 RepID=A0A0C2J267_THEKT|nr:Dehydrodolichyl diphosphate syntase complex subunit Dhdds [Thelohanellus kitauei]KII63606.1 Dehydrodolichyl diphosphate syntase complex subunit Dhdds [Thelohanellus kitauei]
MDDIGFWRRFCCQVVGSGPLPRHIGFIVDGNRRYAASKKKDLTFGYTSGFEKLKEVVQWCRELKVKEISVFGFSLENFNRTNEEIASLIKLFCSKLNEFNNNSKLNEGIRVRIIGDTRLLGKDLFESCSRLTETTEKNAEITLNLAICYASQDELCKCARSLMDWELELQTTKLSRILRDIQLTQ